VELCSEFTTPKNCCLLLTEKGREIQDLLYIQKEGLFIIKSASALDESDLLLLLQSTLLEMISVISPEDQESVPRKTKDILSLVDVFTKTLTLVWDVCSQGLLWIDKVCFL
jgi:hypothetical protein